MYKTLFVASVWKQPKYMYLTREDTSPRYSVRLKAKNGTYRKQL